MTVAVGQSSILANFETSPHSAPTINTSASGSSFIFVVGATGTLPTAGQISDTIGGSASGNSWSTVGPALSGFGGGNVQLFACVNGNGGTGHVFTAAWTGPAQDIILLPFEITGGALTGLVDQISTWNTSGTPYGGNAITPTQANELVVAICLSLSSSGTEVPTFGSGFSQVQYAGDANHMTGGVAALVISAIASTNISYTLSGAGSTSASTLLVSFKAAAGGNAATAFVEAPNRPRPGRGPFSTGHFYVADYTPYTQHSTSGSVSITGQTISFAQGTMSPSATSNVTLTGQAITFAQGAFTPTATDNVTLSGQTITFAQGTMTPSATSNVTLSGQTISFSQGTMSPAGSGSVTLTGQTISFSQGTMSASGSGSVTLTGQTVTLSQGTMTVSATTNVTLTGQTISFAQGNTTATSSSSVTLTGQTISFHQGVMTGTGGIPVVGPSAAIVGFIVNTGSLMVH